MNRHAKSKPFMFVLQHTEFRYPHPQSSISQTNIPHHQRYHRKRSHLKNKIAFKRFLTAVEALHCKKYCHTTVYLAHDTKTCFICDKTSDVMHARHHHNGSEQILRFGPVPPENIADMFAESGLYLEVNTSSQYNDEMPICSDCKAAGKKQSKDYFCPERRMADCHMAENIMYRHWKNSVFWHCCSTVYSDEDIRQGLHLDTWTYQNQFIVYLDYKREFTGNILHSMQLKINA